MSLFGQLRHPITANDTAGSRVYTIWESCKSSPDLRAHKHLQNCFKLFVNNGTNSSLGTECLPATSFSRNRITSLQGWAGQLDTRDPAHPPADDEPMGSGSCTKTPSKDTGVNASRGKQEAFVCFYTLMRHLSCLEHWWAKCKGNSRWQSGE